MGAAPEFICLCVCLCLSVCVCIYISMYLSIHYLGYLLAKLRPQRCLQIRNKTDSIAVRKIHMHGKNDDIGQFVFLPPPFHS